MIMKRLTFAEALSLSKSLKKKSYFSNPFYIFHNCLTDGKLLFERSKIDEKYPLIFLPKESKDFTSSIISTGYDEDISIIEKTHRLLSKEVLGYEYFYSTSEWVSLEGSKFADIRKQISRPALRSPF